jgi:magnesium-transporting ATPase (P-type)
MSVIIRDEKGLIKIICKGADSVLYPLLSTTSKDNDGLRGITEQYLEDYAKEGLRTLLIVEKIIPE